MKNLYSDPFPKVFIFIYSFLCIMMKYVSLPLPWFSEHPDKKVICQKFFLLLFSFFLIKMNIISFSIFKAFEYVMIISLAFGSTRFICFMLTMENFNEELSDISEIYFEFTWDITNWMSLFWKRIHDAGKIWWEKTCNT